jgi:hypothetical protein
MVGRKSRRAADVFRPIVADAPDLSRAVQVASPNGAQEYKVGSRQIFRSGASTERLKSGALYR